MSAGPHTTTGEGERGCHRPRRAQLPTEEERERERERERDVAHSYWEEYRAGEESTEHGGGREVN